MTSDVADQSIIILDRDARRASALASAADALGYSALRVDDCHAAQMLAEDMAPTAILIGSISEFVGKGELCAALRTVAPLGKVLIVVLLSNASERVRIVCLDRGADFCLEEPIEPTSVVRRIQAVANRALAPEQRTLVYQNLELDPIGIRVTVDGAPLPLRPKEFHLLRMLMERPGETLNRADICAVVTGQGSEDQGRTLDFAMFRLRAALAKAGLPKTIQTVRNVGYRLSFSLLIAASAVMPAYLVVETVAAEDGVRAGEGHGRESMV